MERHLHQSFFFCRLRRKLPFRTLKRLFLHIQYSILVQTWNLVCLRLYYNRCNKKDIRRGGGIRPQWFVNFNEIFLKKWYGGMPWLCSLTFVQEMIYREKNGILTYWYIDKQFDNFPLKINYAQKIIINSA